MPLFKRMSILPFDNINTQMTALFMFKFLNFANASGQTNASDHSVLEVESIQRWAKENKMTLNLSKTWEMVVKGKTSKTLPDPVTTIVRKSELKLLGVTFNQDPCNWDTHIDSILHKASSRLYI